MDLKEARTFGNENRHPWELARLKIISENLAKLISASGKKNAHILDIGSGDLFVVEELAKRFPEAKFTAVDSLFSPEFLNEKRLEYMDKNIKVFDNLDAISGIVDVITLFDVVEHIEGDLPFMKMLIEKGYAGKETKVFITVPAYQSLFCSHDVFLVHYRRYTNRSLNRMLSLAGYKKLNNGYFFYCLIFPRILTVLKEKIFKPKTDIQTGLSTWKGGKGKTAFIKGVLMFDYRVTQLFRKIGIRIPGLSNYFICRPGA